MRRLYSTAILVSSLVIMGLALACQQAAPPDTRAADEHAIQEADAALSKAAAARDVDAYVSFFAEDASVLPPNGPMQTGQESIRKSLSETTTRPPVALSWHATKAEVSRGGDLAYSMGTYEVTMSDLKGKPVTDHGKYVTVWKKQWDDRWKVVADIYNSDLPVPGAGKH